MADSFWTDGPDAFAKVLRNNYQTQLNELRRRRNDANESERAAIDSDIERVEADFRSKLDSINDSLF